MRQLSKNNSMTGSMPAKDREGGFALVNIIVAILIFSILGAALVKILSSSTFSQVGSNSSMRAYYLAEGGYRYAGSKFLHAGITEGVRDDMLWTLHNTTYTMANNVDKFKLQSYPWFYKTTAVPTGPSLSARVNGAISPNLTIPASGKVMINSFVYDYISRTINGSNITFTGASNWPATILVNTTVLPVGVSTAIIQTFVKGGNLTLDSVASVFPPYNGTFRIEGNNTVYAYQSRSGNTLTNITDFSNPGAAFSVSVPASANVTLLKYLELHSTGTVGSGIMATNRMVNYRGPISSSATDQGGGESNVIPPDKFNDMSNWTAVAPTDAKIDNKSGDNALEITKVTGSSEYGIMEASSVISDALKAIWSWSNGLSYDEQVKIATTSNVNISGGISFRRHLVGSNKQGFGLSFVYLKNYNDWDIDAYADNSVSESSANKTSNSCWKKNANCILTTATPYLILWKYTSDDPSSGFGFKTIAYYQLPSAMKPLPDWTTLMVRIKEKPSGSSYCSSFSSTRVNEIQVYYSTNESGGGDSIATNTTRLGNLRGSINWPPDTGGTTAQNDYFTLVSWGTTDTGPGWTTGSYQFGNPGDGANTVVCTTENLTNISAYGSSSGPATPFPPEVGLTAMITNTGNHVWFDDFAIGSGPGGGNTTIGFLPPIQQ